MTADWSTNFHPDSAPVYTRNEIRSPLPATALWPVLIRADHWPQWYRHASDVTITGNSPT